MRRAFGVRSFRRGETHFVLPLGELDIESVPQLHESAIEALAGKPARLVLDLRGLGFIDSTGLRLILAIERESQDAGCEFALVQGAENIRRLFKVTDLLDVLPFLDGNGNEAGLDDGDGLSPHSGEATDRLAEP